MTWRDDRDRAAAGIHFFVSYAPADERWAAWIAWELEDAGFRTMLQAWDFVPGTNFIEFMDRGVSESIAVIAVLSRNYVQSRYGRLEWQAALRGAPDNPDRRLITVRVEDFRLEGLLSTITFVDLVGVDDARVARGRLLRRIREAIDGRAKPPVGPAFPSGGTTPEPAAEAHEVPERIAERHPRLRFVRPPAYPPSGRADRSTLTLLHLPGPRFSRGRDAEPSQQRVKELLESLATGLDRLGGTEAERPDALLLTGDLTEAGGIREFDEALTFLVKLRGILGLGAHRVAVVPGPRDVNHAACRAYFANCEADEIEPQRPFWPKWRHFRGFFDKLYEGVDQPVFSSHQPWTIFEMPDLDLAVAGFNSTMAESHRPADHHGWIGPAQIDWFAGRLRQYRIMGWNRVGVIGHRGVLGQHAGTDDLGALRDAGDFEAALAEHLDVLVCPPAGRPAEPADVEAHATLLQLTTEPGTSVVTVRQRPMPGR